jgi:hypothetical protein
LHHADACARKQRVHKTGDEKRDGHAIAATLFRRRSEVSLKKSFAGRNK